MPYSSHEGKDLTVEWIDKVDHNTILDVGPGAGIYADLINNRGMWYTCLEAVEVWKPYIDTFGLEQKYTKVYNTDIRSFENFNYDIVIFGDILEHMTKEEAIAIWDKCSSQAKYALISIPIVHYPQGHEFGNPYEEHVKDDWTAQEVFSTFNGIVRFELYEMVGIFFADFTRGKK